MKVPEIRYARSGNVAIAYQEVGSGPIDIVFVRGMSGDLLDGLSRIGEMTRRVAEQGMPALALTDHGAMYGVIPFYAAAKQAGIKPIIGIEAYVAPRGMTDKEGKADALCASDWRSSGCASCRLACQVRVAQMRHSSGTPLS